METRSMAERGFADESSDSLL
ncbi:unnamed protein product, partial [Adineta steineri]